MVVYMLAEIEVKDPETYAQYVAQARPLVERHGGRYLARTSRVLPVAGDWRPERILLLEFDSLEKLQACFGSEEYRRIAPLRERSTVSRSIVIEGCA